MNGFELRIERVEKRVFAPFPHIAVHVVHTKLVGGKASDRRCVNVSVSTVGVHVDKPFADGQILVSSFQFDVADVGLFVDCAFVIAAPVKRRPCSGAADVFPFCFRRQAMFRPGLLTHPAAVLLSVMPTHTDHRVIFGLRETRILPVDLFPAVERLLEVELIVANGLFQPDGSRFASFAGRSVIRRVNKTAKLSDGDFRGRNVKRLCNPNRMRLTAAGNSPVILLKIVPSAADITANVSASRNRFKLRRRLSDGCRKDQ